ncbi:MAG: cya 3 [Planctomycetaceae bacterium]|nr:cya 3 [Planctomycetaceae bacterium]
MFISRLAQLLRLFKGARAKSRRNPWPNRIAHVENLEERALLTQYINVATTWHNNAEATMTDNVSVVNGVTLTILSGVTVTATGNYTLSAGTGTAGSIAADNVNFQPSVLIDTLGSASLTNDRFNGGILTINQGAVISALTSDVFHGNGRSMLVYPEFVPSIGPTNTFGANSEIGIVGGLTVTHDITWQKIPNVSYRATGDLSVNGGATLTVASNVTVSSDIRSNGLPWTLSVGNGTAGTLNASNDLFQLFVSISSAGKLTADNSTFQCDSGIAPSGIATLTHDHFTGGVLTINQGAVISTFSNNDFHGGSRSMAVYPEFVPQIGSTNAFGANSEIAIIGGLTVTHNTTWQNIPNVSYRLTGDLNVNGGAMLTVAPNLTVSSDIRSNGLPWNLIVGAGTPGSLTANNDLFQLFVSISTAGILTADNSSFQWDSGIAAGGNASLTHDHFTSGILTINQGAIVSLFTNNDFHGNSRSMTVYPEFVPQIGPTNTFGANSEIGIIGGVVSHNTTWQSIPNVTSYRATGDFAINGGATLTLASNVNVSSDIRSNGRPWTLTIGSGTAGTLISNNNLFQLYVADNTAGTLTADNSSFQWDVSINSGAIASLTHDHFTSGVVTISQGAAVSIITNNDFHGGSRSMAVYPEFVPQIGPTNTFGANSEIGILGGLVSHNTTWQNIPNVTSYRATGDFSINGGATLTVAPNVTVSSDIRSNGLPWNMTIGSGTAGTLISNNNLFQLFINVNAAGTLTADSSTFQWNSIVLSGGTASLTHDQFTTGVITINQGAVVSALTNNVFHGGSRSMTVYPEFVPQIGPTNTFGANSEIGIIGLAITHNTIWQNISNVSYRLTGDVNVNNGGALTVAANVAVTSDTRSNGQLWTLVIGSGSSGQLLTRGGTFVTNLFFASMSSGGFYESTLSAALTIDSQTTITMRDNYFTGGAIFATGNNSKLIDLSTNFFGTTDIAAIKLQWITDQDDSAARPLISVANPIPLNTVSGTVWLDSDLDGIQGFNDVTLTNVAVKLMDVGVDNIAGTADDSTVTSTSTNTTGRYAITGLTPGKRYYLAFSAPTDDVFTPANLTDDSNDSDVDPLTARTDVLRPWVNGTFDPTWDAGLFRSILAAPVVDLSGPDQVGPDFITVFKEDLPAVPIADLDATITDSDNTQLASMSLVANSDPDGASEIVTIAGVGAALNADTSGTGSVGGTTFHIAYAAATRTFTINKNGGGQIPIADAQLLLRGITYADIKPSPNTSVRTINVSANDGVLDGSIATATIHVNSVNHAPTNVSLSSSTIAEMQPPGTVVGTLSSTDPDFGNTFTYAFASGVGSTDNTAFTIVGNSLRSNATFDFDIKNTYTIRISTTDQDGLSFESQFTITVAKVNQAPNGLSLSGTSIAENLPGGTAIGTLSSTDPDSGDTFMYSLASGTGNTDNGLFTIVGNELRTVGSLNFESKPILSIRIRTTDQGGLTFDKQFTITVTDVNEAPTSLGLSATSIAENQPIGTTVGILSSTDPDSGNTFTYSLVAGAGSTNNAAFTISGNTLLSNTSFDFETQNSYAIRVRTTDQAGSTFDRQFTVTINNVNESPTDLALSANSIAENLPSGNTVGLLSTTDPDSNSTSTYSLVSGSGSTDNSLFTIQGAALQTSTSFDFETKNSYSILIRTTDQGGLTFDKQFTINVTDANEAPTNIALSGNSIVENQSVGSVVGAFSSTDPDAANTFTYTLVPGLGSLDNSSFAIVSGQLKTAVGFDFETKNSYQIRVRTTDQSGLTFDKAFTVSISNMNEAPTNLALSTSSIAEGRPAGTTVGPLSATDPDSGDTFSYALVSGIGSADNNLFAIVNGQLQTTGILDFETKTTATIRVRTTDSGGLTFEKQITINVNNVNEVPTDILLSTSSVPENQPVGTVIGSFTSADPDFSNTFSYFLAPGAGSQDDAQFSIVNGQLLTSASFDFEGQNSYSIRVRTIDQGGLAYEKSFTISVTDSNDPPTDITLSATTVAENVHAGSSIGILSSTDPDVGNVFTYSLVGGSGSADNSNFAIVNGQLQSSTVFDFETRHSYSIRIRTTDQGGSAFEKQFTISVTDADEAPIDVSLSETSIAEIQAAGTVIGLFNSSDPDLGNTFTYSLVPGIGSSDNAQFTIVNGQLQSASSFDFETQSAYSIRVRTTDQGGLTFEKTFTILVTDVNEAPSVTSIAPQTILEDSSTGPLHFSIEDSETPAGNLTLNITSSNAALIPNANVILSGVGADRNLSVAPLPNQSGTATITIVVSDGTNTSSTSFLVTVAAVNDAPTITGIASQQILEDEPTNVLNFTIADIDTAVAGLTVTAVSSDTTLIPDGNIVVSGTGANRSLVITPAANQNGSATITVTVSDGVLTSNQTFQVTVLAVNDAPLISSNSQPLTFTIAGKNAIAINGTATITNVDTRTLTFAGSVLTVSGQTATDTLSILKQDGISKKGKNVVSGKTVIGTISGGTKETSLTIHLNGAATQNSVQTLLQSIAFKSKDKFTGDRTIQILMSNTDGTKTTPATSQIHIGN